MTKENMVADAEVFLKTLVNGGTGTGKTYYALTHPKVAYLGTEPGGLDTAKANPHLAKNIVWSEEFIPSPMEDIKSVFDRMDKAIKKAHEGFESGEIKTLALDNITYLTENRWMYINKYEPVHSPKTGQLDTRGMYGSLGRWLYQFTLTSLLSFKGNVVVTAHEMTEADETMEKKPHLDSPIVPNILGGFREKIGGMFSACLFLDKVKKVTGGYTYKVRCQKGDNREAKNRYGLPEIIEDVSYAKIVETLNKIKGDGK